MKRVYFYCLVLCGILAALYIYRLYSMGIDIRQGAAFLLIAAATIALGLLIVKLLTKKTRKNMEDN